MKRSVCLVCALCLMSSLLRAAGYYTEPQVYNYRPEPGHEWNMGPIGPSGVYAKIYRGMRIEVDRVEPGTPAEGNFKKGDILLGVNGVLHKGKNPLVVFGTAITEAEATDGILTFDVQEAGGSKTRKVTVKIPVLGAYSQTYPLNCEKSRIIVKKAAEYFAREDRMKAHTLWNALSCLFLLSTGDDAYVPRVKEYFSQFLNEDGTPKGIADHSWFNGYNGIACAEYYLRTGDKSVLPILQHYCDDARKRQKFGLGWGHWGYSVFSRYESGGGVMHSAGNQILATLVLGKLCGVEVDDKTLRGALRQWYRFVGHGAIPASDQRPYHLFRSAGRDGATACLMHIACMAEGDTTIYRKAQDYLAFSALTSWPERTWDWELYWHNLGGQFVRDSRPELYNQTMRRFRWRYDLGRAASGAMYLSDRTKRQDHTESGISLALAYTAPLKTLQITGAPRSKYAKDFSLPEWLWGNKADQAFLSTKNHPDFYKYGKEDEIHVPYWQIKTTKLRYSPEDVKDLPLKMLQKNVRHWRYAMREAAAKALCFNGHYDEIERLLVDKDPRLRRAALDGINDCSHWFLNHIVGKRALKSEKYTPGMMEAIDAIMANPDEAWYVVDGALNALSHAPAEDIEKNIPRITPWLESEDWWLRHSAFNALMGLKRNETLFVKYLPMMVDTMVQEYHYNPRHQMVQALKDALLEYGNDSPAGRIIVAGMSRATLDSEVRPQMSGSQYPRYNEGIANILEVAHTAMRHAPESAADIGEAIARSGRMKEMDTPEFVKLIKSNDGYLKDTFLGLCPALAKVSGKGKDRLSNLLLTTYRPELIKRFAGLAQLDVQPPREKMALEMRVLDILSELAMIEGKSKGWRVLGSTKPSERLWRYYAFDVQKEEERLPLSRHGRLRQVTLPDGMDNWYMPEFDDSKWNKGKAPIGIGKFRSHGHGYLYTSRPDYSYPNQSDWGEKEFIVARTSIMVKDTDFDYFRIKILAEKDFHIYLNGHRISGSGGGADYPSYKTFMLDSNKMRHLNKGKNTLAVFGVVRYEQDKQGEGYHPIGQVDLWLEGLKKAELGL